MYSTSLLSPHCCTKRRMLFSPPFSSAALYAGRAVIEACQRAMFGKSAAASGEASMTSATKDIMTAGE